MDMHYNNSMKKRATQNMFDLTRRGRSENFNDTEKEIMINIISQHISLMDSRRGPAEQNRRKTAILEFIIRELVRKCPNGPRRAVFQVRKWWKRTKIRHKRLARFQTMGTVSTGEKEPNIPTSQVDIKVHLLLNRVGKYGFVELNVSEDDFPETSKEGNQIDVVVIDDIKEEPNQTSDSIGISIKSTSSHISMEELESIQQLTPSYEALINKAQHDASQSNAFPDHSSSNQNNSFSNYENNQTPSYRNKNHLPVISNVETTLPERQISIENLSSYANILPNASEKTDGPGAYKFPRGDNSAELSAPRLHKELELLDLQEDQLRSEHRSKMELLDLQKTYYRRLLLHMDYPTSNGQARGPPSFYSGVFDIQRGTL